MTELLFYALAAGAALFFWIQYVEPNWHLIRRVKVPSKHHPLKHPIRILHLSDLHFDRKSRVKSRFFNRLARIHVDFVFLTGDLIDTVQGIHACVKEIRKLKPKYGVYAVLGNHDYRIYPPFEPFLRVLYGHEFSVDRPEADQLKAELRAAGINLLANENVSVPLGHSGDSVCLVGIDDPVTHHANLRKAFHDVPKGILRLALVHSPVVFPSLQKRGITVAFAGHTHGGQVRLPGLGAVIHWVRRLEPIIDSTNRFGFMGLVSRGVGAQSRASFRFFCRPEALLVEVA